MKNISWVFHFEAAANTNTGGQPRIYENIYLSLHGDGYEDDTIRETAIKLLLSKYGNKCHRI